MRIPRVIDFPNDFSSRWEEWYDDVPPLGFLLRAAFSDRWLRIHSLPGGKRYPTSGLEHAELLRRHKSVAAHLLTDGGECVVLIYETCERDAADVARSAGVEGVQLVRPFELSPELWDSEDGLFVAPMCIFGFAARWNGDDFAGLIAAVADDKAGALVADPISGRVYAPYDGGADLFFRNEAERDQARSRFGDWLSRLEEGL